MKLLFLDKASAPANEFSQHAGRLIQAWAAVSGLESVPAARLLQSASGAWAHWQPRPLLPLGLQLKPWIKGSAAELTILSALDHGSLPFPRWLQVSGPDYIRHTPEGAAAAGSFLPVLSLPPDGETTPFMAACAGNHLPAITRLLKGYSHFSRWQKSEMPLRILITHARTEGRVRTLLDTYRYRQQVQLESRPERLLAGAYCYLHLLPPGEADIWLRTAIAHSIPAGAGLVWGDRYPLLCTVEEEGEAFRHFYRQELELGPAAAVLQQTAGIDGFPAQLQQFGRLIGS